MKIKKARQRALWNYNARRADAELRKCSRFYNNLQMQTHPSIDPLMNYWIMKSEPSVYSIDDLKKDKRSLWTGVRNYQARNFMTQSMQIGDLAYFYHSNCEVPGIYGVAKISSKAIPDPTQFDSKSEYFDPKSTPEKPRWHCVEVEFKNFLGEPFSLERMKSEKSLNDIIFLRPGNRLSICPIQSKHFDKILALSRK